MKTILLLSIALFLLATSAVAQEMHPHKHEASEVLGTVNFMVSGAEAIQSRSRVASFFRI